MVVIADTTPINYLVLIDEIRILPELYERILIPHAVFHELQEEGAAQKVQEWIASPPSWLELRSVSPGMTPLLPNLDPEEREAIQLALQLGIQTVLMDDSDGRAKAKALKLKVRGTLGLLEAAARIGKLDFREAVQRLRQTNFHISNELITTFLDRNT